MGRDGKLMATVRNRNRKIGICTTRIIHLRLDRTRLRNIYGHTLVVEKAHEEEDSFYTRGKQSLLGDSLNGDYRRSTNTFTRLRSDQIKLPLPHEGLL